MTKRGKLIVFEGIDRSGKSTQSQMLFDHLSKTTKCELLRFPNRSTTTGKLINDYLNSSNVNDHAIHLIFSANRWELFEEMKEKLMNGVSLIVDRYVDSGLAYSLAKGLDREWCRTADIGLVKPDITIFLKQDPQRASERKDYGLERFEKLEFQTKVAQEFENLEHVIIDASLSISDIHELIKELVSRLDVDDLKYIV
jgi:dTMP kinase